MTQPNIYMLRDEIRQTLANLDEIADVECTYRQVVYTVHDLLFST